MKTFHTCAATATACCVVLASCGAPKVVSIPVRSSGSLSNQILQEVNRYRMSKGAAPLARNPGLDRLAQEHCEYLRGRSGSSLSRANINHQGFKSRASYARLYYNMSRISENVAGVHGGTSVAPERMVKLWSESPSHDHAMKGDWNATGIGVVVYSDGTVIATQLFGFSRSQQTTFKGGPF